VDAKKRLLPNSQMMNDAITRFQKRRSSTDSTIRVRKKMMATITGRTKRSMCAENSARRTSDPSSKM